MNIFHEDPDRYIATHTAEQIERHFALLELEEEAREEEKYRPESE
jgi:hypothetical protein